MKTYIKYILLPVILITALGIGYSGVQVYKNGEYSLKLFQRKPKYIDCYIDGKHVKATEESCIELSKLSKKVEVDSSVDYTPGFARNPFKLHEEEDVLQANTYNATYTDNDPIINCTFPHSGVKKLKQSECDAYIDCQIGNEWKIFPSRESCESAQEEYADEHENRKVKTFVGGGWGYNMMCLEDRRDDVKEIVEASDEVDQRYDECKDTVTDNRDECYDACDDKYSDVDEWSDCSDGCSDYWNEHMDLCFDAWEDSSDRYTDLLREICDFPE